MMQSIFIKNRRALVTGASAGIGLELARALAPKLDLLVLVARRLERLDRLAKELQSQFLGLTVATEAADLSDSGALENLLARLGALTRVASWI
jgi:short-subunit dehydrogenase